MGVVVCAVSLPNFPDSVVTHREALLVGLALRFALFEILHVLGVREAGCLGFKGPVPATAATCSLEFIVESLLRLRSPEAVVFHPEQRLNFRQRRIPCRTGLADLIVERFLRLRPPNAISFHFENALDFFNG